MDTGQSVARAAAAVARASRQDTNSKLAVFVALCVELAKGHKIISAHFLAAPFANVRAQVVT